MKYNIRNRRMISAVLLCAILSGSVLLTGCSNGGNNQESNSPASSAAVSANNNDTSEKAVSSVSVEKNDTDSSYDESNSTVISLSDSQTKVSGSGAAFENGTVKITSAGNYILRGKLSDGQVVIETSKDDTVRLILDNAEITSSSTAAIFARKCDKTIILLNKGTTNTLTDGSSYAQIQSESSSDNSSSDSPDAALFIQDDLTILGEGTLNVRGNCKNGITSKDTLKITGGIINVTSVNHCITGKDNLYISAGNVTVSSESGDGIRSTYSKEDDEKKGHVYIENALVDITAANDGIQAERSVVINSGTVTVVSGGGSSANVRTQTKPGGSDKLQQSSDNTTSESTRGIKSGTDIIVTGGTITVDSYDDALHSNSSIDIKGGSFVINAGDDGIHASDKIDISGGSIEIKNSYEGVEAEVINISSGTIDINASDDGINCAGGNDQSGFGGADADMQFRNFQNNQNQNSQDSTQNDNTPPQPPQSDSSQGNMQQGQMPQGNMPDGQPPQGGMPDGQMPQNSNFPGQMPGGGMDVDENAALNISGGTIYVNAQGDGLDSNGNITMSGGTVVINGTTSGGNGIIDHGASCNITGGTLIGAGTSDMLEMPDETSAQNTLTVIFESSLVAGTPVYVADSSGKVIAAMTPKKDFGCFILSCSELKNGESYTVYTGGTVKGTEVNGYYSQPSVSGGEKFTSFTLSDSKVTYVNSQGVTEYSGSMGGFPGGGMRGGMQGMSADPSGSAEITAV